MSDNKRRSTAVWIGLISTWFGSHVGAGFATGSQYVVYYGEYGWYSIFTPFVTWAIVGAVFYIIYEYCRLIGATSYKDYAKNFYLPQNKIVSGAFVIWRITSALAVPVLMVYPSALPDSVTVTTAV